MFIGWNTGEEYGGEAGLLHGVVGRECYSKFVAVRSDGLRQRRAAERAVHLAGLVAAGAAVKAATQFDRVVLTVLL